MGISEDAQLLRQAEEERRRCEVAAAREREQAKAADRAQAEALLRRYGRWAKANNLPTVKQARHGLFLPRLWVLISVPSDVGAARDAQEAWIDTTGGITLFNVTYSDIRSAIVAKVAQSGYAWP